MLSDKKEYDCQSQSVLYFFHQFYAAIVQEKKNVIDQAWLKEFSLLEGEKERDHRIVVRATQEILKRLQVLLLEQKDYVLKTRGGYAASFYEDIQYIMVCLADELFLNFDWAGRAYWEDHLLESQVFGSHDAGEKFFKKLDEFISTADLGQRDIGEAYFLALGLGFMGKYRGEKGSEETLFHLKEKLLHFLNRHDGELSSSSAHLFPETYERTQSGGKMSMLQDVKGWFLSFSVVFVGLLFVSFLTWYRTTADLKDTLNYILQADDKGGQ